MSDLFELCFLFVFLLIVLLLSYRISLLKKALKQAGGGSMSTPAKLDVLVDVEKEKDRLEEKNRKLFQMSEAVYKEKKKVDEEVEQLKIDKERLEAEKKKVDEKVKKLWQQSTAIHKEKEKVEVLKGIIEQKHRDVTESINYARRIQTAILPRTEELQAALPQSFVLFRPRDIVSGDFYWLAVKNGKTLIAAVDCTGHGVPGAFMSMVGHTLLNEIVLQKGITSPGEILKELDNNVRFVLKQDHQQNATADGMDICLCTIDSESKVIDYAGANRPLWMVSSSSSIDDEPALIEIKGTKTAIGGQREREVEFQTHSFPMQSGYSIYLSSDGFADQFSRNDKKLMTRRFKEILVAIREKSMEDQKTFLSNYLDEWKGPTEQTDDILVIGIRC